jgi:phospholipase/carboxylesterase
MDRAVIVLHGYGASGSDFVDPMKYTMAKILRNTIFVLPEAFHRCDLGFGRQWFSFPDNITYGALRKSLDEVCPLLFEKIISKVADEYEIPFSNINIMGFSQGAILAFEMLYFANFSHIIAYSGLFACDSKRPVSHKDNRVLIIHGDDDTVVPYSNMKMSSESLGIIGIEHKTHTLRGVGHFITEEGYQKGAEFIIS